MSHPRTMSLRTRDWGSRGNPEAAHSWWCCHAQDFSARNSHSIVGRFIYWAISPQSLHFLVHEIICLAYCWSPFELCFLLLSVEGHTALSLIWKSMCAPRCWVSVFQVCFQVRAHGILYSEWPRLIYPNKKGRRGACPPSHSLRKAIAFYPQNVFQLFSLFSIIWTDLSLGSREGRRGRPEFDPLLSSAYSIPAPKLPAPPNLL